MNSGISLKLPKVESSHCFACSPQNPIGLNLSFYYENQRICSDITLSNNHVGWENIVHGGIITTILDETMGWAIIYFKRSFFVTRTIEVKFIKPVPCLQPLTVQASIGQEKKKGFLEMYSELYNASREVLAKASGTFILLTEDKLSNIDEIQLREFSAFFKHLASIKELNASVNVS